ncbi:hypothetical protein HW49_10565 [Porphyromonadaceae bacterium COT-184 OH4590]|nr:hypothetical protein HW49_10565 [Porphyromonadaceae bacterium COT-184 OH4590]
MRKIGGEQGHCFFIHPIQFEDINRDKEENRKKIVLSRLKQYSLIENPPFLTEEERYKLNLNESNVNDKVDNNLLFSLYRGAVHILVTNDEGIHKKSQTIGLHDKVYRLDQFLIFLQSYINIPKTYNFTGVKEGFLYEIDKKQPFFDSLRNAYIDFDSWYQKSAENQRKCWYIEDNNNKIMAIAIYKEEKDETLTDNGTPTIGKILKLCTFKVDINARGKKLGERLLYIAFQYCVENNFDWIYLHTFGEEQKTLVGLCEDYGFYFIGKYQKDDVYIKPMKFSNDISDPIDSFKRYYPFFKKDSSVAKYIIPIQPKFHEDLFPDLSNLKGSLFEQDQNLFSSQGNTIKKAYLCYAKIKAINSGDIVLFYRSKDRRSIQCMGIVEQVLLSERIEEVFPLIAKRTVYNIDDIRTILKQKTLVILFRYVALNKEITRVQIDRAGIRGSIQSIRKINNEQYRVITNEK